MILASVMVEDLEKCRWNSSAVIRGGRPRMKILDDSILGLMLCGLGRCVNSLKATGCSCLSLGVETLAAAMGLPEARASNLREFRAIDNPGSQPLLLVSLSIHTASHGVESKRHFLAMIYNRRVSSRTSRGGYLAVQPAHPLEVFI